MADNNKLCPVMSPTHNLREIAKNLVLLEDHLFQDCKRCKDCIRKHILTAEALAEECVTLDTDNTIAGSDQLAPAIRGFQARLDNGENERAVAQDVRKLRKELVKTFHAQDGKLGPVNHRPPQISVTSTRGGFSLLWFCVPLAVGYFSTKLK